MELFQVQPHEIDRAWKDGAHKLSEATKWASREITPDQLKMLLARGERVLIGARDEAGVHGWAAVGVVQMPNIRVLHIYSLQGKGVCSADGLKLLKAYAYSLGCTSIRGACRASMVRFLSKLGAKPVYTTIELEVA